MFGRATVRGRMPVCRRLFPRQLTTADLALNEFACRSYHPCEAPFPLAVASARELATTTARSLVRHQRRLLPAQEPQWRQELSMSLRPDDVGEGRARVSLRNSSHGLVGEGVVSLDTVLAEDLDRTEVELHDHDGHSVGNLTLVRSLGLVST